jgi:hypothetical protein
LPRGLHRASEAAKVAGGSLLAGLGRAAPGVQRFRAAAATIDPTGPDEASTLVYRGSIA